MTRPDTSIGTPITVDALLSRGYREFPPHAMIDRFDRLYQRDVMNESGKLYFVNFRKWEHEGKITWDAQLCCDTDTDGYLWATVKEATIEATEARIAELWKAGGGVRYDQ